MKDIVFTYYFLSDKIFFFFLYKFQFKCRRELNLGVKVRIFMNSHIFACGANHILFGKVLSIFCYTNEYMCVLTQIWSISSCNFSQFKESLICSYQQYPSYHSDSHIIFHKGQTLDIVLIYEINEVKLGGKFCYTMQWMLKQHKMTFLLDFNNTASYYLVKIYFFIPKHCFFSFFIWQSEQSNLGYLAPPFIFTWVWRLLVYYSNLYSFFFTAFLYILFSAPVTGGTSTTLFTTVKSSSSPSSSSWPPT